MLPLRTSTQRGQTLPIHLGGILTVLLSSFLLYNWSAIVRLQISAQNEADAAAQLAVLPQVTQFNQMQLALYSANVEEYRLRGLMEALLTNVRDSGGCDNTNSPSPKLDNFLQKGQVHPLAVNCDLNYATLRQAYIASVNRYTQDAELLESIGDVTVAQQQLAPVKMIKQIQATCTAMTSCTAHYYLNAYTGRERVKSIGSVTHDAVIYSFGGADHGVTGAPSTLLTPATADVTVCEDVSKLLPNIFGQTLGPMHIMARSAATPIAVTQEWFEPGLTQNPISLSFFQPSEFWGAVNTVDATGWSSNTVNFSGNYYTATPGTQSFTATINNKAGEFATYASWWSSAIVHPLVLMPEEQSALLTHSTPKGCA